MIYSKYNNISVKGVAAAVSTNYKTVEDSVNESKKISDFNIERFKKNTGVLGRYLCLEGQTCSDLCLVAGKKILDKNENIQNDIGVIVYVTQSPDYRSPATACVLQHRLGISKDCFAIDVNMGCSGFIAGMNVILGLLSSSNRNKALLLCGDICGQDITRDNDVDSGMLLFGDAGTAILLEKEENGEEINIGFLTDGDSLKIISSPGGCWRHYYWKRNSLMDGVEVFNFAVNTVTKMILDFMDNTQRDLSFYDNVVLHQANLSILKQVSKKIKLPKEKMSFSMDTYGNTSCASIPLSITSDYGTNDEHKKVRLLACGFGVGLSAGVTSFEVDTDNIYPVIKTDAIYDDGISEEDY